MDTDTLQLIDNMREIADFEDISFISQNCIGGVVYHDMKKRFYTPTINVDFNSSDFIKFVNNIDSYLQKDINMYYEDDVIVGQIDDIKIYFIHDHDIVKTEKNWNRRKNRLIRDKLFIIATDRNGFGEKEFKEFKKISYPKALVTRNEKWKNEDFVIYLEKYKNEECVPNVIPKRDFYENGKLIKLINKAYQRKED